MRRFAAGLLAICLASACAQRQQESERCVPADAGTPIDAVLLAFLSRARAAHHLADEREGARDAAGAVATLTELVTGPLPHSGHGALAPEVREVLADSLARLADLQSQQAAFDPALANIKRGLEYAIRQGSTRRQEACRFSDKGRRSARRLVGFPTRVDAPRGAPELWVANMIGQHDTRPEGERPPVRYEAIRAGLARVRDFARTHVATVHMPRIGAGLAGGGEP